MSIRNQRGLAALGLVGTLALAGGLYTQTQTRSLGSAQELRERLLDSVQNTYAASPDAKTGEGKCGEGKCGEGKKDAGDNKHCDGKDHSKCDDHKKGPAHKDGEGKCGEGKCGE